ncbi:MAG: hypothetical protein ACI4XP_00160 [Acutalibacteraceae bacterium]
MKTIATVMQITRGLLILTPAEYDKPENGLQIKTKKNASGLPTTFNVPQIFELNDSLKDHPFEKTEELAAFVKRCAESMSMEIGDLFVCIEDEDVLITKEYKHPQSKDKLLPTFARVEAENVLHSDVDKYTILNFEYGQQYGKASKAQDVSASLFAMNTGLLADLRVNFEKEGLHVVKVTPPIAGMLYTAKADLNSATKSIALISVDFAATRLVVLHNGAPVFQQSFSSVLEDIAELLSLEFGMSKMGAIDLIRQEGLGVCNKCRSPQTRKQTMSMLDNAAGEIIRNLRVVISTQRLDIDEIVFCDAIAKIPNLVNYSRSVGLTAPLQNVTDLFTGSTRPPVVNDSASAKGYDAAAFITLNGVLTMPIQEANLLGGESNIMAAIASQNSSKLGKNISIGVGIVAALWMAGIGGWWLALEMQQTNDNKTLNDPNFTTAKQLISDEAEYTQKVNNLSADLEILPRTKIKSADIVNEVFAQVCNKVKDYAGIDINNSQNSIEMSVNVKDYDAYVDLRNEIIDNGYFYLSDAFSANAVTINNGSSANSYLQGTLSMTISNETIEKAEAEENETEESKEESKEESSASGESSAAAKT